MTWSSQKNFWTLQRSPSRPGGLEKPPHACCAQLKEGKVGSHVSPPAPDPPRPCSGAAGSLMEVTWMSAVYLVPAGNSSKPPAGVRVLQSRGDVLSHLLSSTLGSAGDAHHVPVDSLLSAGTWWSSFRSKMNSPQSCLWSPQ